jgi:RNA polymerase sigma factor (TIGR02999 family)
MQRERQGHLLQTAALVNEVYLRLIGQNRVSWQNRAHFYGIAAKLMRRVLVDFARTEGAGKRGGKTILVSLAEAAGAVEQRDVELVALDEALRTLSTLAPRQSLVVELRFFGGLSNEETAEALGVSSATVKHDWSLAKAWLHRELSKK